MHAVVAIASLFSFVASTSAYQVLTPNAQVGWTNQGPQNVTWTRVDTDPLNFTIVLVNQNTASFQNQTLAALVDGTLGAITVLPHNGGWPTGQAFRVNFMTNDSDNNLDTILAQSNQFNITDASGTSSTIGTTFTPVSTATPTGTQTDTAATSNVVVLPVASSGATSSYPVQNSLLALFSLIGFALT